MNPEHLLQHFECISEAPDAIPCLRSFILDLAVRGKLVEQDPNDEPATALLCELREAKERLQEEENIRGRQPVPRTESSELSFPVPDSWEFPAFDDVFVIVSGVTKGRNLAGRKTIEVPYLRVANVQRGYLDLSVMKTIYIPEAELPRYVLRHGDILMTEGGDWDKLGRAAIWAGEIAQCIHQNHVFRVRSPLPEKLYPEWVVTYTNSLLGRSYFENAAKQTTNLASINMTQLRGCPIPLPPLAEQHRIVAKVDELMALCDQLEAAQTAREQCRDQLVAASLHRMNSPAETTEIDAIDLPARQADDFRDHASFVFEHLPRLTTRPEHIKQLRQTILNLAVRGKLVPQDPNDEPAVELFKRIQAEKERLAKDRAIKRLKATSLIDATEVPSPLPETWIWVRLGDLLLGDSQNGYSKKPDDAIDGIPILRISAGTVRQDRIVAEEEHKLIGGVQPAHQEQYQLQPDDLLACRFNGNRSFVGRLSLYLGYLGIKLIYPDKLIRLRLLSGFVLPKLVGCFAEASVVRRDIEGYCATTVGNWGISASNLKEVKVPLPPLAEQHRIVARVDELMTLCDQLEAQLTATEVDSRRLLEAVLHEALTPALEETA